MKIKLRPVQAYELLAPDGAVLALVHHCSSWEGMAKLSTAEGQTLIIESPGRMEQAMATAFSAFGGELGLVECDLVRASPSLIVGLLTKAPEGEAPAC